MDLFEIKGKGRWLCPVRAWNDWKTDNCIKPNNTLSAIRTSDGVAYTGAQFNKDLKKILKNSIDYTKGSITAHSFRMN